jgi:hypothetical protein
MPKSQTHASLVFLLFLLSSPVHSQTAAENVIHTWENVGEVTQVTGKTITIRRKLRLSQATWSLLPGAVSDASQLQNGSQIHAKGSTLPDGSYDAKRIFLISDPSRSQVSGGGIVQGSDHGGPETKAPPNVGTTGNVGLEDRGRGGVPGRENRVPPTGRPGDRDKGAPGGLQSSHASNLPRFLPGDAVGIIEQTDAEQAILSQTFYFDKECTVIGTGGKPIKGRDLKSGQQVAVTIKDEIDEKTQARKATVIRLLPQR